MGADQPPPPRGGGKLSSIGHSSDPVLHAAGTKALVCEMLLAMALEVDHGCGMWISTSLDLDSTKTCLHLAMA